MIHYIEAFMMMNMMRKTKFLLSWESECSTDQNYYERSSGIGDVVVSKGDVIVQMVFSAFYNVYCRKWQMHDVKRSICCVPPKKLRCLFFVICMMCSM